MSTKEKSNGKTKCKKFKNFIEGAGKVIAVAGAVITAIGSVLPKDDKTRNNLCPQ